MVAERLKGNAVIRKQAMALAKSVNLGASNMDGVAKGQNELEALTRVSLKFLQKVNAITIDANATCMLLAHHLRPHRSRCLKLSMAQTLSSTWRMEKRLPRRTWGR